MQILVATGGGVTTAILSRLVKRGCTDAVMLERSPLMFGSTWHVWVF